MNKLILSFILYFLIVTKNLYASCSYNDIYKKTLELLNDDGKQNIQINLQLDKKLTRENCMSFQVLKSKGKEFFLEFQSDSQKHQIKGTYENLVTIPVLNKNTKSGNIVQEQDIVAINIPEKSINSTIIQNKELLIGKVVKNYVHSNTPISKYEVALPILIKRNDIVNVTYTANNLLLNTKALALESGAKNNTIKLRNISSKKEFFATIVSNEEVMLN